MSRAARYPTDVRERAVRRVFEHERQYDSQWAAISSISGQLSMTETLRKWVRQAEADEGKRKELLSSSEREELKALRGEVRELRRANEILKSASAFFAAELDPRRAR